MIPRYQTPEMTAIWSDRRRFEIWRDYDQDGDGIDADVEAWFGTSDTEARSRPEAVLSRGVPDATLEFPSVTGKDYRIEVSDDLLKVIADRIKQELNRPEPVYLILPCGYYELMLRETSVKARKVFELSGFNDPDYPGSELAVITQLPRGTSDQR